MVVRVASTSLVSNSPLRCSPQNCSSCCGERITFPASCSVILCPSRRPVLLSQHVSLSACQASARYGVYCRPIHFYSSSSKSSLYSLHGSGQGIILIVHERQPATDHVARLHIMEGRLWSAF